MRRKGSTASAECDGKPLSSAFTQSSVPSPQSCVTARVVERKTFVVLILTQSGYDGGKQKFPECFQDVSMAKKKIIDDTLLRLIRDGNSPAGAARRIGVDQARIVSCCGTLRVICMKCFIENQMLRPVPVYSSRRSQTILPLIPSLML